MCKAIANHIFNYHPFLSQNSARRSLNGSYYWFIWSKKKYPSEIETLNLSIDTEVTWAHAEANDNIILYDLYKINYSWPINGTVAGHWDRGVGLNYNLTQFKYSRRQDMRGIVFTAGLAVRSCTTRGNHSRKHNVCISFSINAHVLMYNLKTQIILWSSDTKLSLWRLRFCFNLKLREKPRKRTFL